MSDSLGWVKATEEVSRLRGDTDAAVRAFQVRLTELNSVISSSSSSSEALPQVAPAYSESISAWSGLLNAAERLAGFGLALAKDHPEEAKLLVAGTVQELTENLLDASVAMRSVAGGLGFEDPLKVAAGQESAFSVAQEFIATTLPNDSGRYRRRFEELGLPVAGFFRRLSEAVGPVSVPEEPPIRILHVSDIHRTPDEEVRNGEVALDLLDGLQRLDADPIDLIVVSGDIAQAATKAEYSEAEDLLDSLVRKLLQGDRRRCILVPGNHDVSWAASEAGSFRAVESRKAPTDAVGQVDLGRVSVYPIKDTLDAASANFREFYAHFFGEEYAGTRYLEPPGVGLGILAIDTTYGMHHLNSVPAVDRLRLAECLAIAGKAPDRELVIALGHHGPAVDPGERDVLGNWVFERLQKAGVGLYLHGHVHQTTYSPYAPHGVSRVSRLGVGSLVAGPKQRPESTPRHYHLIELARAGRRQRVLVRRKERRDSSWEPDRRYGPDQTDCLEF